MSDSRIRNSLLNMVSTFGSTLAYDAGAFMVRGVFVRVLAVEYLGLEGLFSNILRLFSLMDLGIGSALAVCLYQPVAEKDTEKIKSLMRLYRKAYHAVGCCVAIVGICLTPFLSYLIKDIPDIPHLRLIFLLYVLNSSLSYFCIYKQSLFIANQKNYLVILWYNTTRLLMLFVQAGFLLLTHNFIVYLLVQIAFTRGANVFISRKADERYPYLKDCQVKPLDKDTRRSVWRYAYASTLHGVGTAAVTGTDHIIISAFEGLASGGMYSNYVMVTSAFDSVIQKVFSSFTASVGNLNISSGREHLRISFYRLLFFNMWCSGFVSIGIFCTLQRFISLWVGPSFLLGQNIVLLLTIALYIHSLRRTVLIFNGATGNYYHYRFSPLIESLVNLIASILLVKYIGLAGVPLGTVTSSVTTCFWVEPYTLYKHILMEPCRRYFALVFQNTLLTIVSGGLTFCLCEMIPGYGILSFLVAFLICCTVPNLLFLLVHRKNKYLHYYLSLLYSWLRKISGKNGAS